MKKLYIIRHAKAKDAHIHEADFDRQLSQKGIQDAQTTAHWAKINNINPDFILSSPAERTRKTSEILAEILGLSNTQIEHELDIYEASQPTLLNTINKFIPNEVNCAFLVGHNPGCTLLADYISDANITFMPTCAMVGLEFNVNSWAEISQGMGKLLCFQIPKEL